MRAISFVLAWTRAPHPADDDARASHISGKGVDKKGGSRAQAEFGYRVAEVDSGSQVTIDADIKLTGTLAQMGRTGIVTDVVRELTKEFAANLEAKLAATMGSDTATVEAGAMPEAAKALSAGKLFLAFIRGRWRACCAAMRGMNRR